MENITLTKANKKNRKGRKGRRGPRYWIVAVGAMGSIIAFTVGNNRAMNVAYAENRDGGYVALRGPRNDFATIDFNIPAGSLRDVAAAFEKKTGVKITVENDNILTVTSPGVVGSFTVEQALRQILNGTGISYSFKGVRSVLLSVEAESASVEISGSEAKIIASPKYDGPLRNIPQTISVISKEVIEQQGATTLREVLNNVPGITVTAGEGGAPAGDNLTIRGFSARNDIYVDGVRDLGPQSRDQFNLEQVEVVKGPSSIFTGRGSTGGTINLVSKLPNLRRSFSGTLTGGTDATKRVTADINLPLSDSAAFRLNLLGHDSDFPGRDVVQNRRWGVAPSIILGLGSRTQYSFSYFYIQQENVSDYGIPWVPATNNALVEFRNRPAPVPRSTFYGFVDRDREKLRSDLVTARVEHNFDDNFTVRNQFRFGKSTRDSLATPPRFASNSSTVINRELRSFITKDDIYDNQTDFSKKLKTGGVEHSFVFGTSLSIEKNNRVFRRGPNATTTLLNPNPNDVYTGLITFDLFDGDLNAKSFAGYIFDTLRFGEKWEFVGGLRWDYFDVEGNRVATVSGVPTSIPTDRIDRIFSGRAALIFKPVEHGSIYTSYGTSANPSLEGLSYSPADERLDPEKTRTFELGTKWDLFGNKLLLTGAIFRVEKTNARTPNIVP
ncbi:MAG: TonB-dependent receptor domain-containing protein, partial [Pyrinomonadaceae bacterium]